MCEQHPARRDVLAVAATGALAALLTGCSSTAAPEAAPRPTTARPTAPVLAAAAHPSDLDDPRSLAVVVDKRRPLRPRDWVPTDLIAPAVPHTNAPLLRRPAARALERMVASARADGVTLVSLSAYRSYAVQRHVFDENLAAIGRAATLRLTLKPGFSEHQTGLAVDLGGASRAQDLDTDFAGTAASRWLVAHAWRFGWILRYERAWTAVTGIQFEPWHYRYLGPALAAAYHRSGRHTLEQFSGLPAAPGY